MHAGLPTGMYRFVFTANDSSGISSVVGSTQVFYGDPLGVVLQGRAVYLNPGVPTRIVATTSGGSNSYTFVFSAD